MSKERARELVSQMTLEEKISLVSGLDCWHTQPVERLGVPSIMVSDGPHGLRKQVASSDNFGIGESVPATCFPTASLVACSFDPNLTYQMGEAIAKECKKEDVSVLLGPGINMKRSPLCGRNFEYYSEDPYLAGQLGIGMVKGVQSQGVGTSLKHFAVNNQERRRMNVSAVIDERTLHEVYLKAFEMVVKEAKPRTVMCSYNKINDVYSSENGQLLTDILRKKWGYEGLVMSDWGAVHDRVKGIAAGLDLEMPGSKGANDKKIRAAIENGKLSKEHLDEAASNVVKLVLDSICEEKETVDVSLNHNLAIHIAQESMVLLKNEDQILPLDRKKRIAVVGRFARQPRYQGAGSSKIHPIQIDAPLDKLKEAGYDVAFAEGGPLEEDILKACEVAKNSDIVVVFAGLTERYESEGFDRKNMDMPQEHIHLIEEVTKVNENVVVVLMGGAPMSLPWEKSVKSILLAYLGGEGVGSAVANILSGKKNPSGKLAETWPYKVEDTPCATCFPGDRLHVLHRENIYIGYRYYDTANVPVQYCFGHGLSYTTFSYADLVVSDEKICFTLKNTGKCKGKETILAFGSWIDKSVFVPQRQLIAFDKIELEAGEEKRVELSYSKLDFGFYNTETKTWCAPSGKCVISVGSSLQEQTLETDIYYENDIYRIPDYSYIGGEPYNLSDKEFERLIGYPLPEPAPRAQKPFTMENCLEDTQDTFWGKIILKVAGKFMSSVSSAEEEQDQMMDAAMREMPFFALSMSSDGMLPEGRMEGIVALINGHFWKGLHKLIHGR